MNEFLLESVKRDRCWRRLTFCGKTSELRGATPLALGKEHSSECSDRLKYSWGGLHNVHSLAKGVYKKCNECYDGMSRLEYSEDTQHCSACKLTGNPYLSPAFSSLGYSVPSATQNKSRILMFQTFLRSKSLSLQKQHCPINYISDIRPYFKPQTMKLIGKSIRAGCFDHRVCVIVKDIRTPQSHSGTHWRKQSLDRWWLGWRQLAGNSGYLPVDSHNCYTGCTNSFGGLCHVLKKT